MYCQKCGAQLSDGAKFCPKCGAAQGQTKYCQHCGEVIDSDCVVCPKCGKQVAELKQQQQPQPQVVINNTNANHVNATAYASARAYAGYPGRMRDKWVAFFLCLFLGFFGAHKFYEGKAGMGILYILTFGLFGIGWFIDTLAILFKPNPYYV